MFSPTDVLISAANDPLHSGRNQGFLSNGYIGCIYLVKILAHCAPTELHTIVRTTGLSVVNGPFLDERVSPRVCLR